MSKRLNQWIKKLEENLTHAEIVAGMGNGDIDDMPEWVSMSEHADHIDLIDNETTESFQMGFISIWAEDQQYEE